MLDIVARKFSDPLHHFEHSGDDLLQDFRLFADDFIYDLVRKKRNALQPTQESRRHLVVFVPFLQKLKGRASPLPQIHRW